MKLDLTKPVQLRNGRKARVITTTFKNKFPVLVAVESQINPNLEILLSFSMDGRISGLHVYSETEAENCQLINVPEPLTNYAAEMAALKEELDRHADQMRAILLKVFRENGDNNL